MSFFNSHHSTGWSDGNAGNNSIDASGGTDSIGWADIERSLDRSSLVGSNYGRGGSIARADAQTATESRPHSDGFGLVQVGVSPFRGLDPKGDLFSSNYQEVKTNFLAESLAEPKIGTTPKLNSSLLRVLGNLQNRGAATSGESSPKLEAPTPEAKFAIGLAISSDAEIHQPGRVARAVVRLPEASVVEPSPVAEVAPEVQPVAEQPTETIAVEPEVNPIENPFKYVGDQHAAIKEKFDANNVKYGRTTLLPDGRVVEVQTASDNTTLTSTKGELGATSLVVHDRYRRPVSEQHTDSDGNWSFSNLSYNDSNGIKPFCSEKLTVNSDGSVVKMRFSTMGQVESENRWSA